MAEAVAVAAAVGAGDEEAGISSTEPVALGRFSAKRAALNWSRFDRGALTNEPFFQGAPDTSRTCDQRFRKALADAAE